MEAWLRFFGSSMGLASLVRALGSPVWLELWFHCREILARHVASRLDLAILAGVEGSPVWLEPGLANLASPMGSPS